MMKTIAIIGGMGPQAGIHAHNILVEKLIKNNKSANIVHVSLRVEPFFDGSVTFELTQDQKELLKHVKADTGFIACNTAHHFFQVFQDSVQFELLSIIGNAKLSKDGTIFCSPTSKKLKLFGKDANYASDTQTEAIGKLIERVNNGDEILNGELKSIVGKSKKPIFACTEISLVATKENLNGIDTLDQVIKETIRRI